jgi:hypothetical protein
VVTAPAGYSFPSITSVALTITTTASPSASRRRSAENARDRRGDLLAADVDDDLRHHVAERHRLDGAAELVASA